MLHTILHEELVKFKEELNRFMLDTHSEVIAKEKLEILTNKWEKYEEAKCDYITGTIQAVERRVSEVNKNLEQRITDTHDNCTYRKMTGSGYYEKADTYVKERTKVAGIVVGIIIILATYNLSQIITKLDNIDKNFAQFRLDNSKVIAELQLQAKVNAQNIIELKQDIRKK